VLARDTKQSGDLAPGLARRGDHTLAQQFPWVSRAPVWAALWRQTPPCCREPLMARCTAVSALKAAGHGIVCRRARPNARGNPRQAARAGFLSALVRPAISRAKLSASAEWAGSANMDKLNPWRRAFCTARDFPCVVFGPVLAFALLRLVLILRVLIICVITSTLKAFGTRARLCGRSGS
jgi:hypothetical protein